MEGRAGGGGRGYNGARLGCAVCAAQFWRTQRLAFSAICVSKRGHILTSSI